MKILILLFLLLAPIINAQEPLSSRKMPEAKTVEEVAKEKAQAMLGNVLVTKQTGEEGKEVRDKYFSR